MKKKTASGMMVKLLLLGMLTLASNVQPVKSDWPWTETIYIRADGSVDPATAPISTVDQITYTLTDNIVGAVPQQSSAIAVERDNIVVDGAAYTVQSVLGSGYGINITLRNNVTVTNMRFVEFGTGILLHESTNNILSGNDFPIYIDDYAIELVDSSNNTITGNTITDIVDGYGIGLYNSSNNTVTVNSIKGGVVFGGGMRLWLSSNNTITGNTITDSSEWGLRLLESSENTISENNITDNTCGIWLQDSSDNSIYHNNLVDNTEQVHIESYPNEWDDGYPSGGNYWSDHAKVDNYSGIDQDEPGSDGIVDVPYTVDENNQDNYPLMEPWSPKRDWLTAVTTWYWGEAFTEISSVAVGDVDGDGATEIVTAGYYYDGTRRRAQLAVWDGATLALEGVRTWFWVDDTSISSVAVGDVDGDGNVEIVTGGWYNDGTREVAQLCVWDGATLALEGVRTWYWVSWTQIYSVALGDVDGDGSVEIVTGGYYHDGTRAVAQLAVWDGATLSFEGVTTWFWVSGTVIQSVAVGDVDGDGDIEIVTGGEYWDGRYLAQLVVWDGSTLALEGVRTWYWTSNTYIESVAVGDVDGDGSVEIVTGGTHLDGTGTNAQLAVWAGSTLALEGVRTWNWGDHTWISSVAVGDVDGDGAMEIVTGGYYRISYNRAQLAVWDGPTLTLERVQAWYWVSWTNLKSVAVGDVDGDGSVEIVTGGSYDDGTRVVAQLAVWTKT